MSLDRDLCSKFSRGILMKNILMKVKSFKEIIAASLISGFFIQTASADETVSGLMDRLTQQMASIATFAVAAMFVVGVILFGLSIAKFKEHSDNPGQSKLGKPIGYMIAAAAFISIPSYIAIFTNTLTGTSHTSSNSTGSTYSSIK